jgi:hypothetical protein
MNSTSQTIDLGTLRQLARIESPHCVSIVVPLGYGAWDERHARLELKNCVAEARSRLDVARRSLETDELLAPAEAFLRPAANWADHRHGLAFFLSPELSLTLSLPAPAGPMVAVGSSFDVVALLPVVLPEVGYYVLSLSRNHLKLHRGSRYRLDRVQHHDLPSGMEDELWYERHERALTAHGGARQRSGSGLAVSVHGGQSVQDDRKGMFERYFQHVDGVVREIMGQPSPPLVLAAVQREVSEYRAVSRIPTIADEAIVGNPDETSDDELHRRSWELIRRGADSALVARVADRLGVPNGLASTNPQEILEAASAGRVAELLVPLSDRGSDVLVAAGGGVEGFVNDVVRQTLSHDGDIAIVPGTSLPAGTAVAALFRWAQA